VKSGYFFNSKNLVIWLVELTAVFLSAIGLIPREAVLFVTGLMVFYFICAPLDDALWLFVASIPLFAALPITESFDQMANWRILLIVLFLVLFFKVGISVSIKEKKLKENTSHFPMAYLTVAFLAIGGISLFAATDIWTGIKKIIFLVNAFLLYLIIRNFSERNPHFIGKLIGAAKVAIGTVLTVGFVQLIAVFFAPLHTFWYFWSNNVINTFYGQSLGTLLSSSNTWFSYSSYMMPTLRMFSVFPDSHSFGLFCILSLPFFLTAILLRPIGKKERRIFLYSFLILDLLAILFCGSRGIWVAAIGTIIVFLFVALLSVWPALRRRRNFFVSEDTGEQKWRNFFQLAIGSLILLLILMPIASKILILPQQIGSGIGVSEVGLFDRAKSIFDLSELSVQSRLQIWRKTGDSILTKPFLGVGFGNFPVILEEDISFAKKGSSAHNLYMDIAAEAGIFALLILLAVFWQILKTAWEVFNHYNSQSSLWLKYWAGFFSLVFVWILGYNLFDVVLLNDKVLLFFLVNLSIIYAAKSSLSFHKHIDL